MTIEGHSLFNSMLLAKDKTRGVDEIEAFVLVFLIHLPGFALNGFLHEDEPNNVACKYYLTDFRTPHFPYSFGNQGEGFCKDQIRRYEMGSLCTQKRLDLPPFFARAVAPDEEGAGIDKYLHCLFLTTVKVIVEISSHIRPAT